MGQVSYCLVDKTGTLTTGDFKVRSIFTRLKKYSIKGDVITDALIKTKNFAESGSKKEANAGLSNRSGQGSGRPEQSEPSGQRVNSLDGSVDIKFVINEEEEEEGEHRNENQASEGFKFKEDLDHKKYNVAEAGANESSRHNISQGNEAAPLIKEKLGLISTSGNSEKKKTTKIMANGVDIKHDEIPVNSSHKRSVTNIIQIAPTIHEDLLNKSFSTANLVSDLENSEKSLAQLAEGLALCHSAKTRLINQIDQFIFESVSS